MSAPARRSATYAAYSHFDADAIASNEVAPQLALPTAPLARRALWSPISQ